MRGIASKVVFITGAGGAIGSAIARRFAEAGAIAGVVDRDAEAARRVAGEITTAGGRARAVTLDVTDHAAVRDAVNRFEGDAGPIDVLVSAAGWDRVAPFLSTGPEMWERLVAINLLGLVHLCHAILGGMLERGRGSIVAVASDAGRVGSSGEAVYAAAKGGVIAFAKSIAREAASRGVTVNAVCPGPTDTPLFNSFLQEGEYGQRIHGALSRAIPLKRIARPDDVAGLVVFLASDEASYITGQVVSVSGGLTMHG